KFGYEALIDRANSDLASGLGNLSSRTLTMIARYCDSRIPSGIIPEDKLLLAKRAGVDTDETIAGFVEHARDQFLEHLDNLTFSRALEAAWSVVARVDKMITDAKPWDLAKDENQKQTLGVVLYRAAEALRWLTVLLYPVMPQSSQAMWNQLGLSGSPAQISPTTLKWGELNEGGTIGDVQAVFPRIDKAKTMAQIDPGAVPEGAATAEAKQPPPPMQHATEADAVGVT